MQVEVEKMVKMIRPSDPPSVLNVTLPPTKGVEKKGQSAIYAVPPQPQLPAPSQKKKKKASTSIGGMTLEEFMAANSLAGTTIEQKVDGVSNIVVGL
jgi:hypothetical protein